jgi:hypothetical protein
MDKLLRTHQPQSVSACGGGCQVVEYPCRRSINIPPEKLPAIHGKALREVKRLKGSTDHWHIVADPPVIETADTEEEDE